MVDPATNQLLPRVGMGVLAESLQHAAKPGEGVAGIVWRTGQPLVVNNYDHWAGRIGSFSSGILSALIGVPLLNNGRTLGVLGLAYEFGSTQTFGPETVDILTQFARLAAIAIENARLFQAAQQDLTERRQAEEALRRSEALYHSLVETLPLNIFRKDAAGRFIFVNSFYCQTQGWAREEILGKTDFDLHPRELAEKYADDDERLVASGEVMDTIEEHQPIGGPPTYVHVVKSPVFDREGRMIGLQGAFWDVTERRRLEDALARHAHQLTVLYQTSLEINAQTDQITLLRTIVQRQAELTGAQGSSVYLLEPDGQTLRKVVTLRAAGRLDIILRLGEGVAGRVAQTGQPLMIADYSAWEDRPAVYADSTARRTLGVPLKIGQRIIGALTVVDYERTDPFADEEVQLISLFADQAAIAVENARLFEAERARHHELEAVYEASRQLTQSLDVTSVLEAVATAVSRLTPANNVQIFLYDGERLSFGVAMSEHERMNIPFSQPRQEGLTYAAARSGETIFVEDTLHHPKFNAGATFVPPQLAIAALALKFEATVVGVMNVCYGQPHHFHEAEQRVLKLLATQAATAIQNARLHQQVRDHARQLEERVHERTAELLAANTRLTELDHLKDEFLSRTSHELRTPLTSIKIYLELLETARPEKRDKYLQTLKQETDRLHALIEDVLMFSQLNLNIDPSTLSPINLNDLIEGRLTTWQKLSAAHHLDFQLHLAQDLPHVRADSELVTQALTRLISNAAHYTTTGSVIVSTARIDADDQSWVTVNVKDTGPGIMPDDLPHIFERFYRGHAAADYKTPGTGIGLSICREIVEKLGGRLTVETQVGVGSTFVLWLPIA